MGVARGYLPGGTPSLALDPVLRDGGTYPGSTGWGTLSETRLGGTQVVRDGGTWVPLVVRDGGTWVPLVVRDGGCTRVPTSSTGWGVYPGTY